MTLEEYYKEKEILKAPSNLDAFDRAKWYTKRLIEFQKQLNKNDLKKVLEAERRWQDKVQSSVN